jgi:predicted ATPase
MIRTLAVSGFRSLRDVRLELSALNVVTGANGAGKSSLYRALRLIADIAQGRVIASLAEQGGFPSALWAGPEQFGRAVKSGRYPVEGTVRRHPIGLKLGFADETLGFAIDLGLPIPPPPPTEFAHDPVIKAEALWSGPTLSARSALALRAGPSVRLRLATGEWRQALHGLAPFDSMMTHIAAPGEGLELLAMRERMRGWRFYDSPRTDAEAPARRPRIGTHTPALAGDGADLAAALQTIREIGDDDALNHAVEDAFPGAAIEIVNSEGWFELAMRQPGLLRPLKAAELSEGTLRHLMLVAALLSPRPPPLLVLNEPEASLHPDLIAPLARLIGSAARRGQILVVSHAPALVEALRPYGAQTLRLAKPLGETVIEEAEPVDWAWPSR